MSGAQAETVSTTPTLTSTYSRTDAHGREISPVPLSDTPGGGGTASQKFRLDPTHAFAVGSANVVTSVVLCAQGHAGAVTGTLLKSELDRVARGSLPPVNPCVDDAATQRPELAE